VVVTSVSSAGATVSLDAGGALEEIGAELELSHRRGVFDCSWVFGDCCVYAGDQPSPADVVSPEVVGLAGAVGWGCTTGGDEGIAGGVPMESSYTGRFA
jgi:hypothetical protein